MIRHLGTHSQSAILIAISCLSVVDKSCTDLQSELVVDLFECLTEPIASEFHRAFAVDIGIS
jgi:hypothetical protein